jgi:hypothetical protein
MLSAFGVFGPAIGIILVLWSFIIGFWVKAILKELRETNRILRESSHAGSAPVTAPKAS